MNEQSKHANWLARKYPCWIRGHRVYSTLHYNFRIWATSCSPVATQRVLRGYPVMMTRKGYVRRDGRLALTSGFFTNAIDDYRVQPANKAEQMRAKDCTPYDPMSAHRSIKLLCVLHMDIKSRGEKSTRRSTVKEREVRHAYVRCSMHDVLKSLRASRLRERNHEARSIYTYPTT